MKRILATGLAAATLILSQTAAQVAHAQAPAAPAIAAPKLASGVKAQQAYEAAGGHYVIANPTPYYSDMSPYSAPTTPDQKIGTPVEVLAKVKNADWFLVGKNGEGIGYVARDLLRPAEPAK